MESSINSSRTVVLRASKGYVVSSESSDLFSSWRVFLLKMFSTYFQFPEEDIEGFQQIKYVPAIYTHCYDASGTRLFAAGGPLPATLGK